MSGLLGVIWVSEALMTILLARHAGRLLSVAAGFALSAGEASAEKRVWTVSARTSSDQMSLQRTATETTGRTDDATEWCGRMIGRSRDGSALTQHSPGASWKEAGLGCSRSGSVWVAAGRRQIGWWPWGVSRRHSHRDQEGSDHGRAIGSSRGSLRFGRAEMQLNGARCRLRTSCRPIRRGAP